MQSKKDNFHDKTCTFEGPPHLTQIRPINSPMISQEIKNCCDFINTRIQRLSNNSVQLSHLKLVFKLDKDNYPWLLFCSSVKVRDNNYINKQPKNTLHKEYYNRSNGVFEQTFKRAKRIEVPTEIEFMDKMLLNKKKITTNLTQDTTGFGYCSNCLVKTIILYSLPMKYIKEAYEKRVLTKHDDIKFNTLDGNKNENRANEEQEAKYQIRNLPAIFERIWGHIRKDKWNSLVKNPSWLNLEVKLCECCYVKFTDCSYGTDGNFLINQKNKEEYYNSENETKKKEKNNFGFGQTQKSILFSKVIFDPVDQIYSIEGHNAEKIVPLNNNPTLGVKDIKVLEDYESDIFANETFEEEKFKQKPGDEEVSPKKTTIYRDFSSPEINKSPDLDESQMLKNNDLSTDKVESLVLKSNDLSAEKVDQMNVQTDGEFVTDAENDVETRAKDQTVRFDYDEISESELDYELRPVQKTEPKQSHFNGTSYDTGIAHQKQTILAVSFQKKKVPKKIKEDKYSMEKFFTHSNRRNTEEFASRTSEKLFSCHNISTRKTVENLSNKQLTMLDGLKVYTNNTEFSNNNKTLQKNQARRYSSNKKLTPMVVTEREQSYKDDATHRTTFTGSNKKFNLCVNSIKDQKMKYGSSMKGLTSRK